MGSSNRSATSRFLGLLVFVVLASIAVGGFLITRQSAQGEEEQLLHDRTSEIAVILSTSATLASALNMVGEVYVNDPEGQVFSAAARTLVAGTVTLAGVAEVVDGQAEVRAIEGAGLLPGDLLTGQREDLVLRSLEVDGLVSALIRGTQLSTLVVALGRSDGVVVFEEILFATEPLPATADSPFQEIDAVLYRSPTVDADDLLIATTDALPLAGSVESRELVFGAETWLLQTSARTPLASPQARAVPWIILIAGLIAAVLAGGVVDVLARRRAFAMSLVEQRTGDLRRMMTELDTARIAADSANKAKSHFLSRMSHELRTPLNSVLGFAQLLELNDQRPEDQDAVNHILKGGNHLLNLINEVLDISRIEAGDITMSVESVLASEVIGETLDLMRPLAAARSIHFAPNRSSTCSHYVFADRQRLKQILLNLLSNAVKYNRIGGTVGVSCEQISGTRVRIKVTDTGSGISPENSGRLFVPFERLGADLTEVEGTGIGLALSQRLAEAMGGRLDLESTVGVGSTFWIELPLVEGSVERFERLAPPIEESPLSDHRQKVLYIEDNLANITLVQRIFEHWGEIELVPAIQGRLGIDLARLHHPALILLDLHLTDIPGDEVLQLLRDDPETASIPVVIISADATPGQIQRLQAAGASAYLTKPLNVRELREIATEMLGAQVAGLTP